MERRQTVAHDLRKQFELAGFQVVEVGTDVKRIEVRRYNCSQLLEHNPQKGWAPASPPLFNVRGVSCELEDRGYQKFWYHNGKRFPVRQSDLKTLHHFEEEVHAILGLKSLYHESLGTTSARSVYDRLIGRPES